MTIQELYDWGKENNMLDKEIKVHDSMGKFGYSQEPEKYKTLFNEYVTLLW